MATSLTLNQVKTRMVSLAQSHRQIRTVRFVDYDEALDDGDVEYPLMVIELQPDSNKLALSERLMKYRFKIYVFDLINVAEQSLENEYEVKSDLVSIMMDYHAMLWFTEYQDDWVITEDANVKIANYQLQDLAGGVEMELEVGTLYDANRCQVPADDITFENDNSMKIINNFIHHVTEAAEEVTLSALQRKEIIILFLGINPLTPVTDPDAILTPEQYRYTSATGRFEFGTELQPKADGQPAQVLQIINRSL